jgi:AcrR family transcriptional regulator
MRAEGYRAGARVRAGGRAGARRRLPPSAAAHCGQRSRLLSAIVEVCAEDGYRNATIGRIASRARVSVATFYEQFANKEECFLAAQDALAERLRLDIAGAVAEDSPAAATRVVLGRLLTFAQREPGCFTFLTHEAMLAGQPAADARERLIVAIEREVEDAWLALAGDAPVPDLPVRVWVGAAVRLLGFQMRRGCHQPEELLADLLAWVDAYSVPKAARRWMFTIPNPALADADGVLPSVALAPLRPLPRGRHRLAAPLVERVQRGRIRRATADVVRSKGFASTTVADIVASAGMSREVFYAQFHDKREAFVATCKESFEQTLVAAAQSFFTTAGAFPDRVWEGGRAFARVVESVPSFAYLGFVEAYSLGPREARRIDDALLGFTVFLDEGYRQGVRGRQLPRVSSEAIAGGIVEMGFSWARRGRIADLPALLPVAVYAILAPFIGPQAAGAYVDRRVRELEGAGGPAV